MDVRALFLWLGKNLGNILTLLGIIQGNTENAAQENVPFEIATNTGISRSVLDWSDVSPGPLKTALIAIEADMATMSSAILAAIAGRQSGTSPVILPTTPPTGYGGGATVDDVWGFNLSPDNILASDALEIAAHLAISTQTSAALRVAGNPFWQLEGAIASEGYLFPQDSPRPLNPMNITAGQTRLDWLEAEIPYKTFILDASNDLYYYQDRPPYSDLIWRCMVTQEWFDRLAATALGTVPGALVLPPLWPGLALVTLGTPVSLDAGLTITEPMDGVIVEITSAPTKQGYFTFDDTRAWRNVGALSFFDDNGQQERAQTMAFESGIYCPTTMGHAAGVKLRSSVDVVGTITPWVVTPP
jgi:hypothetical protein